MYFWRLLLAAAVVAAFLLSRASASDCGCAPLPPASVVKVVPVIFQQPVDSWIFKPGRYTHDPETGARVAQYAMKPPIEPLDDPRAITSGYHRSRVVLRGADGSVDTTYRVQSYGNGRGGLDAEWERFHDAWRGATVAGEQYSAIPWRPGFGGYPYSDAHPGYGTIVPGYGGYPGYGGFPPNGYGPYTGQPDAGRLDPDAADGYRDGAQRTPDRFFFNPGLPPFEKPNP